MSAYLPSAPGGTTPSPYSGGQRPTAALPADVLLRSQLAAGGLSGMPLLLSRLPVSLISRRARPSTAPATRSVALAVAVCAA